MTRNHEVRARLSKEEKEKVITRAELCGMKVSDYVRYLLIKTRITVNIEK